MTHPLPSTRARANEGYQVSITLEGSDIENDPLTFRVVDAPVNGALEIGTDGSTVVLPFVDVTNGLIHLRCKRRTPRF